MIPREPDGDEQRFWLALALARTGEHSELQRFLTEYEAGAADLRLLWGDPSLLVAELRRGPALPEQARERVRDTATTMEGAGGRLAALLVEADERPDPASASPRFTAPPLSSIADTDRARVREAIGRARLGEAEGTRTDWRAGVERVVDKLAAADDRRLVWSLVVSELLHKAVGQDFVFGNAVAALVYGLGSDYAPDVDGLLGAYRPLASEGQTGGVGAQIAWAAGGSGLSHSCPGLRRRSRRRTSGSPRPVCWPTPPGSSAPRAPRSSAAHRPRLSCHRSS